MYLSTCILLKTIFDSLFSKLKINFCCKKKTCTYLTNLNTLSFIRIKPFVDTRIISLDDLNFCWKKNACKFLDFWSMTKGNGYVRTACFTPRWGNELLSKKRASKYDSTLRSSLFIFLCTIFENVYVIKKKTRKWKTWVNNFNRSIFVICLT